MLEGRGLGVEEGRHALGTVMGAVQVAFSVTASVRKGEQSAESGEIALNPLAEELAQVLVVQPQFLSMIKAGASWARQHAHLAVADLAGYTTSVSHRAYTLSQCTERAASITAFAPAPLP